MSDSTTKPEPSADDVTILGKAEADTQLWREVAEIRAARIEALNQRVMLVTGVVYGLLLALWIVMLHRD